MDVFAGVPSRGRGRVAIAAVAAAALASLFVTTQRADALLGGFIQPLAEPEVRVVWQNGPDCTFGSALKSGGARHRYTSIAYYRCTGRIPRAFHIEAGTRAGVWLQEYGVRGYRTFLGAASGSAGSPNYVPSPGVTYNPNGGLYPPVADAVWKIRNADSFPAFGLPSLHCWWPGNVGDQLNCVTQSTFDGK
jgi:hypothetical protein